MKLMVVDDFKQIEKDLIDLNNNKNNIDDFDIENLYKRVSIVIKQR